MRIALFAFALSSLTLASGWTCEGVGSDLRAKLYNSTTSTRKPAVFIVSDRLSTFITAKGNAITKKNLFNGVSYSAQDGDGEQTAILIVRHNEGLDAPLAAGETVEGKLVLRTDDGSSMYKMECARYLKNK